jgi:hypothetical protein
MNVDVAKKWAEELRFTPSGQTYGVLREDDSYCVLGVLCELYRRENGGEWERKPGGQVGFRLPDDATGSDNMPRVWTSTAPEPVLQWAGLSRTPQHCLAPALNVYPVLCDEAKADCPNGTCYASLTEANDEYGISFVNFAELIEQQAESL